MTPDPYETPKTDLTEKDRRHPAVQGLIAVGRFLVGFVAVVMMLAGGVCTVLGLAAGGGLLALAIGCVTMGLGYMLFMAVKEK